MSNDVINLVEAALRFKTLGGLFNEDAQCACEIGDLSPASCLSPECEGGYRHERAGGEQWVITKDSNYPADEQFQDWLGD